MTEQKQVLIRTTEEFHREVKHYCIDKNVSMNDLFVSSVQEKMNVKPDNKTVKEGTNTRTPEKDLPNFKLVDVKNIHSETGRSRKIISSMEALKKSIVEIGLLKPVIVYQTGVDEYELISSSVEFEAVRLANGADPKKCEMVNAFVIPKGKIDQAKEQLSVLKKVKE